MHAHIFISNILNHNPIDISDMYASQHACQIIYNGLIPWGAIHATMIVFNSDLFVLNDADYNGNTTAPHAHHLFLSRIKCDYYKYGNLCMSSIVCTI